MLSYICSIFPYKPSGHLTLRTSRVHHSELLEWLDNDFTALAYNRPVYKFRHMLGKLPLPAISDDPHADFSACPSGIEQAFIALFGDDIGEPNARLILAWWEMHPELDLQAWLTSPLTKVAFPFE